MRVAQKKSQSEEQEGRGLECVDSLRQIKSQSEEQESRGLKCVNSLRQVKSQRELRRKVTSGLI